MVQVRRSTVIDAPVERVWAIVRDFNGHDQWHPAVADSELEAGRATDMIGAVRSFHLESGEHLREQLLALSDHDLTFRYCIVESPIPLLGYVATVRLWPVTDSQATFWEWTSEFETPPGREQELATLVGDGVYTAGFEAIRQRLSSPSVPTPSSRDTIGPATAAPPKAVQNLSGSANRDHNSHVSRQPATAIPTATTLTAESVETLSCVLNGYGGPGQLKVIQQLVPPPASHEVQIRHEFVGLNYIDVYCRTGLFPLVAPDGGVPGLEAAGVITRVGNQVSDWQPGDRVAYATLPPGAYTEIRNLAADRLVRLPDDIGTDIAAAALVKGLTAHFLLHDVASVKPGDTVLVHAAAGGVGLLLCQWARHLGARVIGTVGSETKRAIAAAHGCEHVINYGSTDFAGAVAELTRGEGVNVVIDGVGQATFNRSLQALAIRGHLVSYGQASGAIGDTSVDQLAEKSVTLSRPNFGHYTATNDQLETGAHQLFERIRTGSLKVPIGRQFALRDASLAHEWLESRQGTGTNLLVAGAS